MSATNIIESNWYVRNLRRVFHLEVRKRKGRTPT